LWGRSTSAAARPSLAPAGIAAILDRVRADRLVDPAAEVTLEANPDDVSPAAAEAWRAAGVTRLSLGAQSFSDEALRWMHRTHEPAAIGRAVAIARAAGLGDISLDLIFALPADVPRSWEADLDRALALAPDHVSLCNLTTGPIRHSPLDRGRSGGSPDDARYAASISARARPSRAAGLGTTRSQCRAAGALARQLRPNGAGAGASGSAHPRTAASAPAAGGTCGNGPGTSVRC
jgi:oxygen-independent coproporphyrinogen-3 oxidase